MLTTMKVISLRLAVILAPVLLAAACAEVEAQSVVNTAEGVAIHGYDAVAYHTEGRPVPGNDRFSFQWEGAEWRFASAENRDLFASDPQRYAPAYGGYCAWAVSRNGIADIDPSAFVIHNGRLYLNINERFNRRFSSDLAANIQRAEQNWPGVRSGLE